MTTDAKWSDLTSLDRGRTVAAANQLLPPWVGFLLVVLIGWQLARIIWMLIPGPPAGESVPVPAGSLIPESTASAMADVAAIASAHLFGIAEPDDAIAPEPQVIDESENLQDTRLTNLALKGTIASVPSESSVAIIADGNKEEKVYKIGDPVTAGARLHAVYADRVVLNENGILRKLDLPKEFIATSPTARRNLTTTQRTRQDTQTIQSVVAQNISRLADVIRPTPYFVNGQIQGYRVYPGRNRAQFAALGLRPGDLIKDIDGQSLSDQTQAMQIFESLGNSDQVSVTVERNGQPEVLVLSTSQLELGNESSQ